VANFEARYNIIVVANILTNSNLKSLLTRTASKSDTDSLQLQSRENVYLRLYSVDMVYTGDMIHIVNLYKSIVIVQCLTVGVFGNSAQTAQIIPSAQITVRLFAWNDPLCVWK